jgi:hypothetical protein
MFLCVIVLVGCGVVFAIKQALKQPPVQTITMSDGTQLYVAGTSYGTNHVFGNRMARLVVRMPSPVQDIATDLFGPRALDSVSFTTPTPMLVLWLKVSNRSPKLPPPAPLSGWYDAYLGDTTDYVSGPSWGISPNISSLLQFSTFPRRDRSLTLHVYSHDSKGRTTDCGELSFVNPGYHDYPQWRPQTLPATNRTGDVEAVLTDFGTGHGEGNGFSGGNYAIQFETNNGSGRTEVGCRIHFHSLSDTNQMWQVTHVELSDATGNVVGNTGMTSWGGQDLFEFAPALWPGENAWKMRCEIKRTAGFTSNEIFTFKNVPIGPLNQIAQFGWATNINGVTVTLDHLIVRPPITNTYWNSSQLSEANFLFSGLSNDIHCDLISTRTDTGSNIDCAGWSSSGTNQDRQLQDIPTNARSLDFTFAMQQGRWVEFLVKPQNASIRFEDLRHIGAKRPQ